MKTPLWLRLGIPLALIIVWLIAAGIGGPYFGKISEVSTNNLTDFLPKSSESAQVQGKLAAFTNADSIPALLIFGREGGLLLGDQVYLRQLNLGASPPIVSLDGKAAQIIVPIDRKAEVKEVVADLRRDIAASAPDGLAHYVAGPAGFSADLSKAFGGIDGILLGVALLVVFLILLIVYRSPALPLLVLMTAVMALSASILIVWWLAHSNLVRLNGQVQGILFILVIGATTDYALLYVSRYREELQKHQDKLMASMTALRHSMGPIIASGSTVIVGLMCLLLSDLDSNKALGPVGGIGIAVSMLAALTFLPAVLYVCGRRVFWPFEPHYLKAAQNKDFIAQGFWKRAAWFVGRHARVMWAAPLLVLMIAAAGIFYFKASGVEQGQLILGQSEARDGQELIAKHFPAGSGSPAVIIGSVDKLGELVVATQRTRGVDSVSAVAKKSPVGVTTSFEDATYTVVRGQVMLRATLSDAPDSPAAEATVKRLRQTLTQLDRDVLVGGATATSLDTTATSIHDRALIIPVILAAIFLILIVLLRSLVVPLLLILSTALSFAATLGVSALVFNVFLGMPGADASVPLYAFVFLVALGIDYNIFLMTRVREEALVHGTTLGVKRGLAVTGGVITSAGIVLAATFAALAVIPILFLAQLAFIVAFGVLLDTIVVRSMLVPGLITDVGRSSWWPSKKPAQ